MNMKPTDGSVSPAPETGKPTPPDCGDTSCMFAPKKSGMRTNGGCRCYKDCKPQARHYVQRLHVEREELLAALRACAEKFREYEAIHRNKAQAALSVSWCEHVQRTEKAQANASMAEMCERVLSKSEPSSSPLGVSR